MEIGIGNYRLGMNNLKASCRFLMTDNIKVLVRIRPFSQREISEGSRTCVWVSEETVNNIILDGPPKPRQFAYDWTGGPKTSQQDIFNSIGRPMVDSCISGKQRISLGYNSTVFAYGQTGAGKTYTMLGKSGEDEETTFSDHRGLQPRCIDYLYWKFDQLKSQTVDGAEFLVKCTYVEIYKEQFVDLVASILMSARNQSRSEPHSSRGH